MNSKVTYSPEVVKPVIERALRSPDASDLIASLIIQIQEAAYVRGRSEVRCEVFRALFKGEYNEPVNQTQRGILV